MAESRADYGASNVDAAAEDAAAHSVAPRMWSVCADRLAQLAASDPPDGSLLNAAAEVLRGALRASAVAVYSVADGSRGVETVAGGDGLTREALAGEEISAHSVHLEHRLRAAARAALRQPGVVSTYHSRANSNRPAAHLLGAATGSSATRTAFVAWVQERDIEAANTALHALRHVLSAVAHTAHLRRELERSGRRQSQLQAIFTHSSEAILTVDRGFTILESNPALSTLLEWRDASPVGKHCSEVLKCHDERGQLLCATPGCPLAQAFVLTNSAPYREVTWRTVSGKSTEVSASFAAVPSTEGVRGVIIARDMTPVNAANRMRSNFISMVSHELRNPLNSINGFLEIVLEGHVGSLTTRQEEFLDYARMSTHQLMTLVEDILFISRADTGQFKLRFAAVALSELTAQLVMQFGPVADRAQVELSFAIPDDLPTVYVDQLRIQQVISNLLNNAIKFTPPGGAVQVRARVDGDGIQVDVSDTGEGIPIEDHERIFERFYQSGSNTLTQAGGYGLGLAIARLIVRQHGGRIWVTSSPGHGSTFSVMIPMRPHPSEAPELGDEPAAG